MAKSLADVARAGDIVLFEPKRAAGGSPLSQSVVVVDESPFSHAALLETSAPPYRVLSANEAIEEFVSGVNRIPLAPLAADRRCVVLRPRSLTDHDAAAAVAWGQGYIEHDTTNESDFGWEELTLSAMAGLTRQMAKDSLGRRMLWDWIHDLSWRLEGAGWTPRRWDCCEFVVRAFDGVAAPLRIVESDPLIHRAGAATRELMRLWSSFAARQVAGFLPADFENRHATQAPKADDHALVFEACDDDDGKSLYGEICTVMQLLERVARTAQRIARPVEPHPKVAWPPSIHEPAWPPFVSPRMLHESCETVIELEPGELR
jgi:hypothetical protein